jgi:FimV-like protein
MLSVLRKALLKLFEMPMNSSRLIPISVISKRLLPLALISVVTFQSVAVADTRYGPVRSGETLSSIVNENYILSPFPDQVIMQEIFRNNNGAFIGNNIGLLKQGVTLTLPSDASIAALLPSPQTSSSNVRAPVRATVREVVPAQSQNNRAVNELQERLTLVRAERDRAKIKLSQFERERADLTSRIAKLESSNSRLNANIKATDESLRIARAELLNVQEAAKADIEAAKSQLQTSAQPTQVDQSGLMAEREKRIKALETSIAKLQDDHASELLELKTSLEGKGEEQVTLQGNVDSLTDSAEKFETQIAQLKIKNESLVVELAESKTAYDQLLESKEATETVAVTDSVVTTADKAGSLATTKTGTTPQADTEPFDISNLNAQNVSSQLEKPVTFPLWGMLLGALALALTTLLMFLARGRAKKATAVAPIVFDDEPVVADDVVFRAADPERIEPDIEALRVPPRRDPSRVAILDPTMIGSVDIADQSVIITDESALGDHETIEVDLKLAMAEAYGDLGDVQAANELLIEVQQEGSQKQAASAQILLSRLAG